MICCRTHPTISTVRSYLVMGSAIVFLTAPMSRGGDVAELLADQVDQDNYVHYHQDLLYTWMGDNRGFGSEHDLASDNILAELGSFPQLTVSLEPFLYNGNTYHNVVATQVGTDFSDAIYVVGAHFDSVNNPGADDNATGTAAIMEIARVLSQHRSRSTIKYCAFDREEQGLRGSRAFVLDHQDENIVMAVTIDMVGHDSGSYGIDIFGSTISTDVITGVANAIDLYGGGLAPFLSGPATFSDHWAFEMVGIPAMVAIERCFLCNPYYHTPQDAVDNPSFPEGDYLDYSMPTNLARAYVGFLVEHAGVSLWYDTDDDTDIDFADYGVLQRCFGSDASDGCAAFDQNRDNVIDMVDYAAFVAANTGPISLTAASPFDESFLSIPATADVAAGLANSDH
jgi:peptidase M28-like protein